MKKNKSYLAEDEINLGDIIILLWRKKILTLFISIICGLVGYFYASFQSQEFEANITLRNPPAQLFEPYSRAFNNKTDKPDAFDNSGGAISLFNSNFNSLLLSLDNLQIFTDQSTEFDNFKGYLKSRNISADEYFSNKIYQKKKKDLINQNKFYLLFPKELEGDIFFNNYVQFIKKKTISELKKDWKRSIENTISIHEQALEKSILIKLTDPILRSMSQQNQVVNEPEDLFYKGSIILSKEIDNLKKRLILLENDQFDFEIILEKSKISQVNKISKFLYFVLGLTFGLFLSLGVIFFKIVLKNN